MKNLLLLFLFLPRISNSQNTTEQKIDSLVLLVNTKEDDTSKVNLYQKIILTSRDFDINMAILYNSKLLSLSKKLNYKRGIGLYYFSNSYIFSKRDLLKSIFYAKQAKKTFLKVKDSLYYLKATCFLADAFANNNKFDEAKQILLENVAFSKSKGHYKMTGVIYQQIGCYFIEDNSLKKSLNYFKKSLEYHEKEKSPDNYKSFLYMYMAYVSNKLSNHDEALGYVNLSIQFAKNDLQKHYMILEKINTYLGMELYPKALKLALDNDSYYIKNDLTYNNNYIYNLLFICKSYFYLKKYNLAIKVANQILNQNNLNDDLKRDANKLIANSYFKLNKKNEANEFINKAISFSNPLISEENDKIAELYFDKSIIEESLGNDKIALYYHRKYIALKEKMEATINADKVRELQVDFNVSAKNNKIKSLQISQLQKNIQISNQKNYIVLISVSLFLAFLSVFFFVKINGTIKQKNKLITLNNINLENAQSLTKKSLIEKEILLKEIHHRVKNNMQLIISLLNIQSRVSECDIDTFLSISKSRITSMALIHELLYQSTNINQVNFKEYLYNLSSAISTSYNTITKKIDLQIQAENIYLDLQTAIPIGLIINELVTNSYKHAFTNKEEGTIMLQLIKEDKNFKLIISDNGSGKILLLDKKPQTLGIELVKLLVLQINGIMSINNTKGSCYKIEFQNIIL